MALRGLVDAGLQHCGLLLTAGKKPPRAEEGKFPFVRPSDWVRHVYVMKRLWHDSWCLICSPESMKDREGVLHAVLVLWGYYNSMLGQYLFEVLKTLSVGCRCIS